jgi:hypothetical protein
MRRRRTPRSRRSKLEDSRAHRPILNVTPPHCLVYLDNRGRQTYERYLDAHTAWEILR